MKIGIADPQTMVRYSLRILLEQQPGWMVGGEAANCQELMDLLRIGPPDLLLIEWDLPDLPAENLLHLLQAKHPLMRIIAMSWKQELRPVALQAGVDAFVCKTEPADKLLKQIQELKYRTSAPFYDERQ